jgi:hypothetical protein
VPEVAAQLRSSHHSGQWRVLHDCLPCRPADTLPQRQTAAAHHRVMVAAMRAAMLYGPKLNASGPWRTSSTEYTLGGGLADLAAAAVSCRR